MAKTGTFVGRVRVAVVDDDEDTRLYFKDILRPGRNFVFAGAFPSATEALIEIPRVQPDLVLMDIILPDMDGIECTKRLKQLMPRLKVVIVSGKHETDWFDRSLSAGAAAYVIKPFETEQLLVTLRFVANRVAEPILLMPGKSQKDTFLILNAREKQVMDKLAEGLLYKEISDALGISYSAVHKCQHKIFLKLHVSNRSEAVRIWLQSRAN